MDKNKSIITMEQLDIIAANLAATRNMRRSVEQDSKKTVNKAKCKLCGDIIESKFTHDMQWCSCGAIAVVQVLEVMVEDGEAPAWFQGVELFHPVEMEGGKFKDLAVLGQPGAAVIVDDAEGYILPSQKAWWVGVSQFTPHDECESDCELEQVRQEFERRYL